MFWAPEHVFNPLHSFYTATLTLELSPMFWTSHIHSQPPSLVTNPQDMFELLDTFHSSYTHSWASARFLDAFLNLYIHFRVPTPVFEPLEASPSPYTHSQHLPHTQGWGGIAEQRKGDKDEDDNKASRRHMRLSLCTVCFLFFSFLLSY